MSTARAPRTRTGFFEPPTPRILAHRGLALHAPENTIAAFSAAWDAGARYLETDVRATRDGQPVLSHDDNLRRVAGIDRAIADTDWSELRTIDVGGGHHLAHLTDLLTAFPDARINIDVKSADAAIPAATALRELGAVDRVLVTSFDEARRRSAIAGVPAVATSASSRLSALAIVAARLHSEVVVTRALRGVDAVQLPRRRGRIVIITPEFVHAVHRAGSEVHVWTVNDPDEAARLLSIGVDGIFTDRCDLLSDLLT